MKFQEFCREYPSYVLKKIDTRDIHRICEIADRGQSGDVEREIGRIVLHRIEVAKVEAEHDIANPTQFHWPVMLRKQAD